MKKIAIGIGILILIGLVAYPVFAFGRSHNWGSGMMAGGGGGGRCGAGPQNWSNDLTKEQVQQIEDLHKKFQELTKPIRTELHAKQAELFALMSAVKPDQSKALAVQKEISELQAKLAQERVKHRLEIRKISPDAGFGRWAMMGGRQGRMAMRGSCGGSCAGDND